MEERECPQCGCVIGDKAFRKAEVIYCCEPCAESCKCECGCVNESAQPARHAPMKGNRRGSA